MPSTTELDRASLASFHSCSALLVSRSLRPRSTSRAWAASDRSLRIRAARVLGKRVSPVLGSSEVRPLNWRTRSHVSGQGSYRPGGSEAGAPSRLSRKGRVVKEE